MPSFHPDGETPIADARQHLRGTGNDIEDIPQRPDRAAGDQVEELKEKARSALNSLRDIERRTQAKLDATGQEVQKFVHEKPWTAIATALLAAYALGLLTRLRR